MVSGQKPENATVTPRAVPRCNAVANSRKPWPQKGVEHSLSSLLPVAHEGNTTHLVNVLLGVPLPRNAERERSFIGRLEGEEGLRNSRAGIGRYVDISQ